MVDTSEERPKAIDDLVHAIELAEKDGTTLRPYTMALSNWLNGLERYVLQKRERKVSGASQFIFEYELRLALLKANGRRLLITMVEEESGNEKKMIEEKIYTRFCIRLLRQWYLTLGKYKGKTQMDSVKEDNISVEAAHQHEDGAIGGSSAVDKESNVILKVDSMADQVNVLDISSTEINKKLASTEEPYDLIKDGYSIMNRWYPLQQVVIQESSSDLFSLQIPSALYSDQSSVNLLPLKGFIYGDLDLEFRLVVNAAPFHAGRLIMGIFYCSQGYNKEFQYALGIQSSTKNSNTMEDFNFNYYDTTKNTMITDYTGMVQRPHVIIDLAQSTTASLIVKYNYNKPFVRLLDYDKNPDVNPGVVGGNFVNLRAMMISKLKTGDDQPKSVNCTLFYRFVKAKLTGMTRQHALTQMDVLSTISEAIDLGQGILGTGVEVINTIERQLTRKGKRITNRDKPSMQFSTIPVVPRFRNHFPNGVGISDAVIMGMDVKSLTTHYEDPGYGPRSYNEYAKIPGITKIVTWPTSVAANIELFSEKVVPHDPFIQAQYGANGESNLSKVTPLPISIASNGFMYWSGTIVYEFDFVKTAFHKGLVMISINFGKKADTVGSNYEKIVDIQETSKVKITVPYIYDTVARRTNNSSILTTWPQYGQWNTDSLPPFTQTSITLVVMNPLINVESVSNSIDVIVWKYGGPDFSLHTPCQVNNIVTYVNQSTGNIRNLQNFPSATTDKLQTATEYLSNLPHSTRANVDSFPDPAISTKPGFTQGPSDDFRSGIRDETRFHTGDETNFKNLLRMPVKIVSHQKITSKEAFCLPVAPLSVEMIKWYLAHPRLAMTHQSQIIRMFRMWRGTIRYTILAHANDTFYVSYLPADGTWKKKVSSKLFNERIPGVSGKVWKPQGNPVTVKTFYNDKIDIAASGNFITLVVPKVNPSEQIEIPWNLPVNWALMNQGDREQQVGYRDIGNCPNGHVVIYGDSDITFSIFMSVGDDFEMGAFCGMTDNIVVSKGNRMDDVRMKTQMDFRPLEETSDGCLSEYYSCDEQPQSTTKQAIRYIKRNKTKFLKPLIYGGASLLPMPISTMVQGLVIAHTVAETEQNFKKAEKCIEQVAKTAKHWGPGNNNKILSKIEDASVSAVRIIDHFERTTLPQAEEVLKGCTKVTNGVSNLVGRVQSLTDPSELWGWICSTFSGIGSQVYEILQECFKKMFDAIFDRDYSIVADSFREILVNLGLTTRRFITQRIGQLMDVLKRIFNYINPWGTTQAMGTQNELDSECFDTNDFQTFTSLLLGGVISVFGDSASKNWQKTYKEDSYKWTNSLMSFRTISGVNATFTFIKNVYGTLYKMVVRVLGMKDQEMEIREALSSKSSVVSQFCRNAQDFLNDYNNEAMSDPIIKSKFWITICNAYQIRASLCQIKGDSATQVLKTLCNEVIKKSNETMSLFKSTCVRYEPFVVCLEGDSGIGKSFLTTKLSVDILNNLDLKMSHIDFRYNVSPGVDYWNLYNGQPIIIYDDWCNLVDTQSVRKEISELYQLKTSNVMNAPKAELSEKKTVVNPFAVLLATNNPFPRTNALIDHTPLYRRRDVLVKVQLKENVDRSNPECYKDFKHLQFAFYQSSAHEQREYKFMDFPEFQSELKRRHMEYHKKESQNVKSRIAILSEALSEQALLHQDIEDPFTLQARSLYEAERKGAEVGCINSLPSEALNFEVMKLIETIEEKFHIIKAQNSTFIIQDTTSSGHSKMAGVTQGITDTFNTYFITPVVKTWQTLYTYLNKWLRVGYHCHNCSKPSIFSGICMSCPNCNKIFCGWCTRSFKCQCNTCSDTLVPHMPKFFDLIIAYIAQASVSTLFGPSWRISLASKLISLFFEINVGVPLLVISFMNNLLKKDGILTYLTGPIPIESIAKTQSDTQDTIVPGLPSNFQIVDVPSDGDCLAHAIYRGLVQFPRWKDLTFASFKKNLGKKRGDWYDTDTNGLQAVKHYTIPIHIIEKQTIEGEITWVHSIITSNGVKQVKFDYKKEGNLCVHILALGDNHFRAILVDDAIEEEISDRKREEDDRKEVNKKSILDSDEEIIKMEPLDKGKEEKTFKLVKPGEWWYDKLMSEIGKEEFCKHGQVEDLEKIEGSKVILGENFFEIKNKKYPFARCNTHCVLTKKILKEVIEGYYSANLLEMEEEVTMFLRGLKPLEDDVVPKVFHSTWLDDELAKVTVEVTNDENWFYKLVKLVSSYSVGGVLLVAIMYCVKKSWSLATSVLGRIGNLFFGNCETQSYSERRQGTTYQASERMRKIARKRSAKTQGNIPDSEHYINIKNKVCQNYVTFKTDTIKKMIGIGLYGSVVLIPKHYIAPLQKAEFIEMQFYQAKHEKLKLNPTNLKIRYFGDKDCALVEVSKAIYFADIRKFFMPQGEYDNFMAYKSEILIPTNDCIHEQDIKITTILPEYEAYDDYTQIMFKTKGAIEYTFEQKGACGSLVFCKNRNHPIVAMHIAGHEGYSRGVGARICVEELGNDKSFDLPDLPFKIEEEGIIDFGEEVNVEYLGKIAPEMTPFLPTKTNIEHSLIDEHFEEPNKVQPAILSAKDPRYQHKEISPLVYGVKKHGKPTLDFNKIFVTQASEVLCEQLLKFKWQFSHKVQIYDVKTAALGLKECVDYYEWLPDSTSAGWPYNVIRNENGPLKTQKKYWMKYERGEDGRPIDVVLDPLVLEHLERDMELRRNGTLAPIVFQDVLKDEKRPIEKLMKPGGTRVFSMSPLNASLALRQYSLDLTSYLRSHRVDNWMGIGINPDGPEWGKMVSILKTKGDNIFTIDYSNFGPGLNVEVASEFRNLMKKFYGKHIKISQEDENVMDSLIYELMYSIHLAGGTLYRTKSGSPSGAAITVEINSFTHLMYLLICWQIIGRAIFLLHGSGEEDTVSGKAFLKLYKPLVDYLKALKLDYENYIDMDGNFEVFYDNVVGVVYGDDGIFSVTDEFREIFNAKTLALTLGVHGICATDASKKDEILAYSKLQEASFLKRKFAPHPTFRSEWLAPIELTSVEECARWIQKGQGSDVATIVNAKASLILAYGHGPHYFNSWKKKLNTYLAKEDLPIMLLTWENLDQMFYSSYYLNKFKDQDILDLTDQIKQLYSS